jgi:hypothetical protein
MAANKGTTQARLDLAEEPLEVVVSAHINLSLVQTAAHHDRATPLS